MYSTYETPFIGVPASEAQPSDRKKIVILGGGPNRIGQGIEFDYCCCHACFALADAGFETIMINCNPETVSTDYDTSDRLYFEPLTNEDVSEILDVEKSRGTLVGVIVQYGGQTPLKLAHGLAAAGAPILGTPVDFDRSRRRPRPLQAPARQARPQAAQERHRLFGGAVAHRRRRTRPAAGRAPVLCAGRPRHGDHPRRTAISTTICSARCRASCPSEIKARYPNDKTGQINMVLGKNPLLFDRYLTDAIEVDVDCVADGETGGHRGRDGAYRGSRHSFGRLGLLAAAALAVAGRRWPSWRSRPRASPWRSASSA